MNSETAARYFIGTFTGSEREFLLAHPDFKTVLAQSTEDLADLRKLNSLGVKLLLNREYQPPAVGAPAPIWK